MDKEAQEKAHQQTVYKLTGLVELIRGDLKHYFKQLGTVLFLILITLVVIAFKV